MQGGVSGKNNKTLNGLLVLSLTGRGKDHSVVTGAVAVVGPGRPVGVEAAANFYPYVESDPLIANQVLYQLS